MDPVKISSKKDFHILFDKLFIDENTLCVRTKEALPVKKTRASIPQERMGYFIGGKYENVNRLEMKYDISHPAGKLRGEK